MHPSILVAALGPGDPQLMTMQTVSALRAAEQLVLRTAHHPAAAWLSGEGIAFTSLDSLYDTCEDFDTLHQTMAERLWRDARHGQLVFAVPDPTQDGAVSALRQAKPTDGRLVVLPGVSWTGLTLSQTEAGASGWRTLPASAVETAAHDPSLPLVITELDSAVLAGMVKLRLTDIYPDEAPVWFLPSQEKTAGRPRQIPLCELDRQKHYDHTVRALIPPLDFRKRERFTLADLETIMGILRAPGGCPWDRLQTHASLRKYLLEEAYEAAGAIDEGDDSHLADELGDVLLQIVFHASIAQDHGSFTMTDIATAICHKMIYRHAHIFGDVRCADAEAVSRSWEQLKKAERGFETQADALRDVSRALPALTRAAKVQKKAANAGFDWPDASAALPKVREETEEVLAELPASPHLAMELGDLLFAAVNVTRLSKVDPEEALTQATEKFIRRFARMEELTRAAGLTLEGMSLDELIAWWKRAKAETGENAATSPSLA